jgi:branched-chain amino acid aminotransferase
MFVSRGPGSFSVSPNDTVGTQLYVVVTDLHTPNLALYQKGVQVILSKTPQKPYPFAQIKSCNYLPNVLMKRESLAAGADFAVGVTGEGFLAEGPTENFFFIDSEQNFVYPNFDYTLAGTTLIRVAELAKTLVSDGMLKSVVSKNLTMADLRQAREGAMVGTTLGVLPIRDFAGVQWPAPGVVCTHLARLFKNELQSNEQIRTSWT